MSAGQQDLDQHAAEGGWQPQQQPPVQPKKRHWVRWTILSAIGIILVIVVASCVARVNSAVDSLDSATTTGPASSSQNKEHPPAEDVRLGRPDLTHVSAFEGPAIVEVSATITNHSSKRSDYMVTVEIIDTDGNRLGETAVIATDVAPGQSVKESAVADLNVDGLIAEDMIRANVLRVERTAA
jgi:hypothetical protein